MRRRSTVQLHTAVMQLAAVLLILVLLTTCLVTGRFARYVSSDSQTDSARIAAYVFRVEDNQKHFLDISSIQKPGDVIIYKFTVTNKSGSVISEVSEEFYMSMELRGSLPLNVSVVCGDEKLALEANEAVTGATHVYQAAVETNRVYTMTVSWPGEENDISYSWAGLSQLALNIHAQQID